MNNQQSPIKVFIAESHYLASVGLRSVLAQYGRLSIVGEARDGETATRLVSMLKPDIVLLDFAENSVRLASGIAQAHPDAKLIAIGQDIAGSQFEVLLQSGTRGFCYKDIAPDRLYAGILTVTEGDLWVESRIVPKLYFGRSANCRSEAAHTQTAAIGIMHDDGTHTNGNGHNGNRHLSSREVEILMLISQGLTNRQIASRLYLSVSSVKAIIRRILDKLQVDDRTEAAVHATRYGLI